MKYKEFKGSIEFSEEDDVFFGKILNIKDLVLYEGVNVAELEKEFKNAVNDYINTKL